MRIVKEWNDNGLKVTCFQLDHKYLVKYESGPQEITYKFKMGEGMDSVDDLSRLINEHLTEKAIVVLKQMQNTRLAVIDTFFKQQDDFEEII